jgi:hypothetical protein
VGGAFREAWKGDMTTLSPCSDFTFPVFFQISNIRNPLFYLSPYWKRLLQRAASTSYWVSSRVAYSFTIVTVSCSVCVLECPRFPLQGLQTYLCSWHYVSHHHTRPWATNTLFPPLLFLPFQLESFKFISLNIYIVCFNSI